MTIVLQEMREQPAAIFGVEYLHVRFLSFRVARAEMTGGKRDYLVSQVYKSVEAPPGDCVLQLFQRSNRPLRLAVREIRVRCVIL